MPKFKIKFSDQIVNKAKTLKNNGHDLFKPNNFLFKINEVPGTELTFYSMSRKAATNRALKIAPGCTFSVREFSNSHANA